MIFQRAKTALWNKFFLKLPSSTREATHKMRFSDALVAQNEILFTFLFL